MATYSFSSVLDHTGDVGFRNWVGEFGTALTAIGLTQTADTGQLTTATLTRPGTATAAGYQIYQFNDPAQSSLPIYLRIEFGTNNIQNVPAVWVSAGSATNGSGTLTANTWTTRVVTGVSNNTPASTTTAYASYFSYNTSTGFLGWNWKNGAISGGTHSTFMIGRSCNSTGAVTTSGVTTFYGYVNGSTPLYMQSTNNTNTRIIDRVQGKCSIIPGSVTSSVSGSNTQAFLNWTMYPLIEPINWKCTVLTTEFPYQTTFTATLVGSTFHTYLSIGTNGTYQDDGGGSINATGAMIWE